MYWSKSAAVVALYAVGSVVNALPSSIGLGRRDVTLSGLGSLSISSGCQSTITNQISSPAATCLNLPGTVAIISTVANSSLIPPIDSWLTTFCEADPCTSDQLTSTIGSIADGCSAELTELGVTKDEIIQEATTYFSIAKEAACLRDSNHGNNLCAIETLQSIETAIGQPLTIASLEANAQLFIENDYALAKQIACTPCMNAAFGILQPVLTQDILSTVDTFVNQECGANFTATPTSGISVVTGSDAVRAAQATASSNSASTNLEAQRLLVVVMAAVSVVASLF